jgi:hypothetical protein
VHRPTEGYVYGSNPLENGMLDHFPEEVVAALKEKLGKKAA